MMKSIQKKEENQQVTKPTFTDYVREVYHELCTSNGWATVDEILAYSSWGKMVYDKIRRFQFESRGPLLEIEVGLKTDYPYTPASLRRMRLNDYYHGFCDLNFPEYHVCTIYEFMYDLPEYYGYQGDIASHLTCKYGDKSVTIASSEFECFEALWWAIAELFDEQHREKNTHESHKLVGGVV